MAEFLQGFQTGFGISSSIRDRRRQRRLDEINIELRRNADRRDEERLGIAKRQEALENKKLDYTIRSGLIDMVRQGADPAIVDAQVDTFFKNFGGDPKGDQAKNFKKLLRGINDQTRADFVNMLETVGPDLPPGTVQTFAKAIATGRVDLGSAIGLMRDLGTRQALKGKGKTARGVLEETGDIGAATALQKFEAGEGEAAQTKAITDALQGYGSQVTQSLLGKVDRAQTNLGIDLGSRIRSARRDPAHNAKVGGAKGSMHLPNEGGLGRAFDIQWGDMGLDEKKTVLREMLKQGITGTGIGTNTLHVDTGRRRAWGYNADGSPNAPVPKWAREVINEFEASQPKLSPAAEAAKAKVERIQGVLTRLPPDSDAAKGLRAQVTSTMNSPGGLELKESIRTQAEIEAAGPTEKAKIKAEQGAAYTRELTPFEKSLVGAPLTKSMTVQDLAEMGGYLPHDPKIMTELKQKEVALNNALNTTNTIIKKIENRKEAVGTAGQFAQTVNSLVDQVTGFTNLIPGLKDQIPQSVLDSEDEARSIIRDAGNISAQVESAIISLGFQSAALAGQQGHGVSNFDFINMVKQIVAGGQSNEAMIGVLRAYALAQSNYLTNAFRVHTGLDRNFGVAEDFSKMSTGQLKGLKGMTKLLTREQALNLEAEVDRRIAELQKGK